MKITGSFVKEVDGKLGVIDELLRNLKRDSIETKETPLIEKARDIVAEVNEELKKRAGKI